MLSLDGEKRLGTASGSAGSAGQQMLDMSQDDLVGTDYFRNFFNLRFKKSKKSKQSLEILLRYL